MITEKKLDLWANLGLNVLITGEYGVGKTAVVNETFHRQGLKLFDVNNFDEQEQYYLYFSAGTMDPFVDMIGVPREQTKEVEGTKFTYLDLLRPLPFATDRVVAIFMDELNRATEKVRNAVMEIIQFKSINGKKFNNLKMIWAAVNPEDEQHTYDVERLDPAQKDRFHIHTSIDFKPDKAFFVKKYGEQKAKAAIDWWENIDAKLKKTCSPRRLDYALELAMKGVELADVLDRKLNVGRLSNLLVNGLARERLIQLLDSGKDTEAEQLLQNDNVYTEIEQWFTTNPESTRYREKIWGMLHAERVAKLLTANQKNEALLKPLFTQFYVNPKLSDTINSIFKNTKDKSLKSLIIDKIPLLESDKIGKNPVGFTPTKNTTTAFSAMVENLSDKMAWASEDSREDGNQKRLELIKELQNTPRDLTEKDALHVSKIALGIIKHANPEMMNKYKNEVFGPLNYALKKQKMSIVDQNFYKMEINKMIKNGWEEFLWTPSK